jgi:hypothetical protein
MDNAHDAEIVSENRFIFFAYCYGCGTRCGRTYPPSRAHGHCNGGDADAVQSHL